MVLNQVGFPTPNGVAKVETCQTGQDRHWNAKSNLTGEDFVPIGAAERPDCDTQASARTEQLTGRTEVKCELMGISTSYRGRGYT